MRAHALQLRASAAARCGKEYSTCRLHCRPFGGIDDILRIARTITILVDVLQRRCCRWMRVAVGEDNHTVHVGHLRHAVARIGSATDGAAATGEEDVAPLIVGQRAPQCRCVATIADGVINAPVGIGTAVGEVAKGLTGDIIVGTRSAGAVGVVSDSTAVPARCAPAEEVYIVAVGGRGIGIGLTKHIILVLCETPCAGTHAVVATAMATNRSILQIAFRKAHMPRTRDRKDTIEGSFDGDILFFGSRHEESIGTLTCKSHRHRGQKKEQ